MHDGAKKQNGEPEPVDIDLGLFTPYLLHNLDRHFQLVLAKAVGEFELTIAEWRTLVCLNRLDHAAIDEIVKFTHLPQSTISRNVSQLEDKGLVSRRWNKEDQRIAEIRLSRPGQTRLEKATDAAIAAAEAELGRLAGSDANQFIDVMRKVLRRLGPEKFHDLG